MFIKVNKETFKVRQEELVFVKRRNLGYSEIINIQTSEERWVSDEDLENIDEIITISQ